MTYTLAIKVDDRVVKILLVNENGDPTYHDEQSYSVFSDEKGYLSVDCEEIYKILLSLVRKMKEQWNGDLFSIHSCGIACKRGVVVMFDKERIYGPSPAWQCLRGEGYISRFLPHEKTIQEKTGLYLSPYLPSLKMKWLLENVDHPMDVYLSTLDAYLLFRLTGNYLTDISHASKSQLFNIHTLRYDNELCQLFNIPEKYLAPVIDSDGFFGMTTFGNLFPRPLPINASLGDENAALYYYNLLKDKKIRVHYDTFSSVLFSLGQTLPQNFQNYSCSIAWRIQNELTYILEEIIPNTTMVLSWFNEIINLPFDIEVNDKEANKANPEDLCVILPTYTSTNQKERRVKTVLANISMSTGRKEIIKAGIHSIAFQVQEILDKIDTLFPLYPQGILVDGSIEKNSYLLKTQSSLSSYPLYHYPVHDISSLGIALLALRKKEWTSPPPKILNEKNNSLTLKNYEEWKKWKAIFSKEEKEES